MTEQEEIASIMQEHGCSMGAASYILLQQRNDALRSRLAELESERTLIVARAENAEAALVEAEGRLAEAVELLSSARGKIDTLTIQGKGCQRDIDAFLAREKHG